MSLAIVLPPAIAAESTGAWTEAWTMRTFALPPGGGLRSSLITRSPRSACRPTPATVYALPVATVTFVVSTGGSDAGAPAPRIATAYVPVDDGAKGVQLFDYNTDPGELKNLADDKQYANIVMEMKAKLKK